MGLVRDLQQERRRGQKRKRFVIGTFFIFLIYFLNLFLFFIFILFFVIGTDCSGTDAPLYALRRTKPYLRKQIKIRHAWSCDVSHVAKQFIMAKILISIRFRFRSDSDSDSDPIQILIPDSIYSDVKILILISSWRTTSPKNSSMTSSTEGIRDCPTHICTQPAFHARALAAWASDLAQRILA